MTKEQTLITLVITTIVNVFLTIYLSKKKNKNQLNQVFICALSLLILWSIGLIAQIILSQPLKIEPIYFDYFVYIGACFVPVAVFFMGIIYANTKIEFKKRYLLLFIVPIISLITLWTNDYHHLFYRQYSTNISDTVYGPYIVIHNIYSYILLVFGIIYMLKFSIKNSGFFSRQSMLIVLGVSVPVVVNILGTFKIIPMSIYVTPITFTITIICCAIAIFKFQFLNVTPIALQKIVDRISDGYVVLDENNAITDFNKTFLDIFKLSPEDIRSKNFIKFLQQKDISSQALSKISQSIKRANATEKTVSFEQQFVKIRKYFRIEITPINSDNNSLGTLFLLKDITQHKEDMETIKNNQDILMERERLAGLGQLIGGIAHNLKTPIMSIAGATQGLENLIKEYDESIDDPLVNSQDHHDIARDMEEWIPKIRAHLEYMSDIITTVKGQAVASLSTDDTEEFAIAELIKRVNILMKHELKNAYIYLNVLMKIDENQIIHGNVNVLVQVINNMISNAIQAYDGKHDQNIQLEISKDSGNVIFSVTDFAGGLPKEVQDRLFKEMVTTKGKNGTGLGLYMSYSNIKAHFGGDITYQTEDGKGTTFNILIPINK
ncbi:MAG: hypothetical protein BHV99_05090 [Clostridium sp. 26_21]|nr:MAG: hypothetical protein BHV99_05090 [Clostridium sp. 26_21]